VYLQELKLANGGSQYLIVYPDISTLRKIYSSYIKTALDERNELVIALPSILRNSRYCKKDIITTR
jgi:hypothetical protein